MSKSTIMQTKQSKQSKIAWKPHGYQKKAVKFMLKNSCAGLLLDPGLGKTSISLKAGSVLLGEGMIDTIFIIAPLRVCYSVWPKEIAKWKDFEHLEYAILHGKDKEKNFEKEVPIYIINPEGLSWLLSHPRFKKKLTSAMLVVDESSKFKSTSSQRFKLLRPWLTKFRRRYILTGSFVPNGLLDILGQMYIVDTGEALGSYITHYRNNYFYPTGFGGYEWKLQDGAEERIQARIKPSTLRLAAEDYLDLPEMVTNRIEVELPPHAMQAYKEMEDELITSLRKGDVTAATAAVASMKCRQIANGGVYDEFRTAHFIHDEKAKAVADLIDELNGTPALIAYDFEHDLHRLRKVLGKDVPYIGGGVSAKKSDAIEQAWNAGDIPVLLGHPASIAHGLNLQNAGNHVIWHSLTWNFEHYDQFNKRILRQGSKHKQVYVHHIMAKETIDDIMLFTLGRKNNTQKDLYAALNEFYGIKKLPKR